MRKISDVTSMEPDQTAQFNAIIDDVVRKSLSIKYVVEVPTVDNVSNNEIVIYDDGAGTKRLYTITAKGNLGYVALT